MPGPRFFSFCYRLTAYQGAVAHAWRRQQAKREQRRSAGPISLAAWAAAHPEAMQEAHERMSTGR